MRARFGAGSGGPEEILAPRFDYSPPSVGLKTLLSGARTDKQQLAQNNSSEANY